MAKRPLSFQLFLFLLFFFSLAAVCAQEHAGQTPALYKLESDKAVMYFFGSIHVGTPDMFPLNEKILKAFGETDNLVVEINILNVSGSEMISLFRKKLMYGKGESLDNVLPPQDREQLVRIMKDFSLPYQTFKLFKPVVIDTLLTDSMAQSLGYKPENGIDLYFLKDAGKTGKTIIELESLEEQMTAIGSIPDDAQLLMLLTTLNRQEETEQELTALVEAWEKGDIDMCYSLMEAQYEETPGLRPVHTILVTERNIKMKERLEALLKKGGKYFVVGGAGHFTGAGSIIDLFAKEGYTITRQ